MKKLIIVGLTALALTGCSSKAEVNVIKGTSNDFTVEAKFEDGILVYLNENGDELSKEDIEGTQKHFEYMAQEMNTEPMLYYFEALNKTFNEIDGDLTLNGNSYQEERPKIFENEYSIKTCTYSLGNNDVNVHIKNKDVNGLIKQVDIEFISPVQNDEIEKQRLNLSYLNMLNNMFGERAFTIDDLQGTDDGQSYKVIVSVTSDLLAEKKLNQIDLVDLISSLKANDFECK